VVKEFHTEADLFAIAKWISGAKRYFLQGYKDSGNLISDGLSGFSAKELEKMLSEVQKILPVTELRGL
jgi:pyruvate formate lyase activating enzyme